jgi:hypothetical protein
MAFCSATIVQNRMSLRETDLIQAPKHSPPTIWLSQYTDYGFAPDIRSCTAAAAEPLVSVAASCSAASPVQCLDVSS